MELKTRRYLYTFFILIFLIITPTIWLYATGYKLGNGFKIQKTGILILDSEPQGATVYLNGKKQKSFFQNLTNPNEAIVSTPTKIKGLLPEEYTVRLELDNYWSWEKKLEIKEEQSTYAENISLFRNNLPLNVSLGTYDKIKLSPNQEWLIINNSTSITLIYLNDETKTIYELNSQSAQNALNDLNNIRWSANSKNVIIDKTLFSIDDWLNPHLLNFSQGNNLQKFKWHNKDNVLYYLSQEIISSLNPENSQVNKIYSGNNLSDYLPVNDKLFFIEQTDSSSDLKIWNKNSANIEKTISLPLNNYEFINSNHSIISLFDDKHQLIYLIEPDSPIKPIRDVISNANKAIWINDTQMLYANNFEIFLYDLNSRNRILLTRISKSISQIFWHPNNNYVLFSTNKYISSIELDKRDKYNITRLVELDNIKNPVLNKTGDTLFFLSQIGNQEGVYKLNIQ